MSCLLAVVIVTHWCMRQLIDMTGVAYGDGHPGMYPSVGACDEFLRLFLYQRIATEEEIREFEGKLTGEREHGELITLQVGTCVVCILGPCLTGFNAEPSHSVFVFWSDCEI
jgi:hypothetical protein